MDPATLTLHKVAFLGLLYLSLFGAVVAVYREVSPRRARAVGSVRPVRRAVPTTGPPRPPSPPRPSSPPRHIVVVDPPSHTGRTFDLNGEVSIGRSPSSTIVLDDTFVSSAHARIFRSDDGWCVEDLGSTNGTTLNGETIRGVARVGSGDRVQVGETVLELRG